MPDAAHHHGQHPQPVTATDSPAHRWNVCYRRLCLRDAAKRLCWAVGATIVAVTGWWWGWSMWIACGIIAGLLAPWITPASDELDDARVERPTVELLDQLSRYADVTVLHNKYIFGVRVHIPHIGRPVRRPRSRPHHTINTAQQLPDLGDLVAGGNPVLSDHDRLRVGQREANRRAHRD